MAYLEFCRLVSALLIDEDGVYDPRSVNDRLLLGMKGTLSEMKLSTLRQRSQAGLEQKAHRGELFTVVPIGFVRAEGDRLGDHTELEFAKNRTGQHRWVPEQDIVELVRSLARQMPDGLIASVLNRMGKRTAHSRTWNKMRVCSLRNDHRIAVYREGEREERGELTLEEAAAYLQLNVITLRRMIAREEIPATQFCAGTAWVIHRADLEDFKNCSPPLTMNGNQFDLILQSHREVCIMSRSRGARG